MVYVTPFRGWFGDVCTRLGSTYVWEWAPQDTGLHHLGAKKLQKHPKFEKRVCFWSWSQILEKKSWRKIKKKACKIFIPGKYMLCVLKVLLWGSNLKYKCPPPSTSYKVALSTHAKSRIQLHVFDNTFRRNLRFQFVTYMIYGSSPSARLLQNTTSHTIATHACLHGHWCRIATADERVTLALRK